MICAQDVSWSSADIDRALVPLVSFEGEEDQRLSLEERRQQLGVRAASVAVMREGNIAWARAYGENVDEDTVFQFASLSKPVAAAGIIAFAFEQGVGLEDDIAGDLPGLDMAQVNPDGAPITLRALLSHTNGTSVSGFPGYAMDKPVPTTLQVIEGSGPTNTDPVIVTPNPSGERRYSGGGYTLAQYWAEQKSGENFPALMRRLVLDPIGMKRSTFASGTAETFTRSNVAPGYYYSGEMVPGGWNIHPEQAAASLWSTPREYLLFVRALMLALDGDSSAGIDSEIAQQMTTPIANSYGLGIGVSEVKGEIRLSHSGSNVGYKSNFMAYPATKDAVISVVNSDKGWAMVGDIGRTANVVYQWPVATLPNYTRMMASDAQLQIYAGDYREQGDDEVIFTLAAKAPSIVGSAPSGYRFELVQIGEATFVNPEDGRESVFTISPDGEVSVTFQGTVFVKRAAP